MLFPLVCAVQNYAWGKVGLWSSVAQLVAAGGVEVDQEKPYAELWMGTHPNGPSRVLWEGGPEGGQPLAQFLEENPQMLASKAEDAAKYGVQGGLPYLFKVLSVNKALSIQAHPDKKLAEKLHAERPDVYKDPNHKPEMACAITEFEALCGFMPLKQVLSYISSVPELKILLSSNPGALEVIDSGDVFSKGGDEKQEQEALKTLFTALMASETKKVKEQVNGLSARLENESDLKMPHALALRLSKQYPGDVGVLCAYFMYYRKLEPGQACFLGANEPHAYLAGDCTEIMANSDNVVRAGLTPKLRDVPTLCSMLTYRQPSHSGAEFHPGNLLEGKGSGQFGKIYSPPDPAVTEFQMERNVLSKEDGSLELKPSSFASIMLILSGSGEATQEDGKSLNVKKGDVYFQPCSSSLKIEADLSAPLVMFRASLKSAF